MFAGGLLTLIAGASLLVLSVVNIDNLVVGAVLGQTALGYYLLAFRQEKIVPLMTSGRAGDPVIERTGPKALTAEWPFAAGTLRIALDFGSGGPFPDRGDWRIEKGAHRLACFVDA